MSANGNHQVDDYFRISRVLQVHDKDVRCLAPYKDSGFVTGSRDKTGKLFLPGKQDPYNYIEAQVFRGPDHFVSCVCVLNPGEEEAKKGVKPTIYLGSNDAKIYAFTEDESSPVAELVGHSGTVSALSADDRTGCILSGSWDMTAILWKDNKPVTTITGHTQAIWATEFLGNSDLLLTGSADQIIKAWSRNGDLVQSFIGHTDCVRSLRAINEDLFMSCSNDGTLKRWSVSRGGLVKSYDCHSTYIYSMTWVTETSCPSSNKIGFVTCSEDKTSRVFVKGKRTQVIPLPGDTLWSVITLENESRDLVIASASGYVFVLTKDVRKVGGQSEREVLKVLFDNTQFPATDIGSKDILNSLDDLNKEEKVDGNKAYVREGDKTLVFMYLECDLEWTKVGFIQGSDKKTLNKTEYNGKLYDYVITVDMEDGQEHLKLPFNQGDDPRKAAEDFVQKHNLPINHIDTIELFIKNTVLSDQPQPQ